MAAGSPLPASISTTLNIYTHVVDTSHRKAVEDVERRLFGEVDPNGPKTDEQTDLEESASLMKSAS